MQVTSPHGQGYSSCCAVDGRTAVGRDGAVARVRPASCHVPARALQAGCPRPLAPRSLPPAPSRPGERPVPSAPPAHTAPSGPWGQHPWQEASAARRPRPRAHLRGAEAFQPALCPSLAPWSPPQRVRAAPERPDARLPRSWAAPSRGAEGEAPARSGPGVVGRSGRRRSPPGRPLAAGVRGRCSVLPDHLPAAPPPPPRPAGDARDPGPVSAVARVGFCGDPVCAFPLPLPPESGRVHPSPCRACRSLGPLAFFPVPLP